MAKIGSIGDIVFETSASRVRTFDSYTDSVGARIGTHDIGGGVPVLEYIGTDTREIGLSITLNARLGVDVESDISTLQGYSASGRLVSIVLANEIIGGPGAKWLIERADTTRARFDGQGRTMQATISLSLKLARTAATPQQISGTVTKSNVKSRRA